VQRTDTLDLQYIMLQHTDTVDICNSGATHRYTCICTLSERQFSWVD
jgi:hypothetical protein